jgi:hypothetical protein
MSRIVTALLLTALSATAAAGGEAPAKQPAEPARAGSPAPPSPTPPAAPAASTAPADPAPTAEQAAEIAVLIRDLGSEKYPVRQSARKALLDIGRPALSALRTAAKDRDAEIAANAAGLIVEIETSLRAKIRIKVRRPDASGEKEIIVEGPDATVTVRENQKEFTVAIERGGGKAEVISAPTREEFAKKFPDVWKQHAEPALDAADPDKLAVETMVRQLLPKVLERFAKEQGRPVTAAERAEAEKTLREEVRKAFVENRVKKQKEKEEKERQQNGEAPPPPPPEPAPEKPVKAPEGKG